MEISPGSRFTIWRKLEDPSDSATYYVQATIYDMRTNAVIQTTNLTDQTGRIFSKDIDAPQDSSGQGRYIAISTRVYTDSGYTTLSAIHREESREYKVIQSRTSFGGGGVSVDYDKILKMVKKALEDLPKPDKVDIDLTPLQDSIQAVGEKVDAIDMPTLDLSPILGAIRGLKTDIENAIKSIPKPDEVDLVPIMNKLSMLDNLEKVMSSIDTIGQASEKLAKLSNDIKEFLINHTEEVDEKMARAFNEFTKKADAISNLNFTVKPSLPEVKEPNVQDIGLSRAKNLLGD